MGVRGIFALVAPIHADFSPNLAPAAKIHRNSPTVKNAG